MGAAATQNNQVTGSSVVNNVDAAVDRQLTSIPTATQTTLQQ
jgi:hypothetical protein